MIIGQKVNIEWNMFVGQFTVQDGKLMLDRRRVWDVVEFQDCKGFQGICRKKDGK